MSWGWLHDSLALFQPINVICKINEKANGTIHHATLVRATRQSVMNISHFWNLSFFPWRKAVLINNGSLQPCPAPNSLWLSKCVYKRKWHQCNLSHLLHWDLGVQYSPIWPRGATGGMSWEILSWTGHPKWPRKVQRFQRLSVLMEFSGKCGVS